MASFRQLRSGKWQVQVRLKGVPPIARSFDKKSQAVDWARITESEITRGTYVDPRLAERTTVARVIDRYYQSVVHKGRQDHPLLGRLDRLRVRLGNFTLKTLRTPQLVAYRDERLEEVSAATVAHELSLMLRVLRVADGVIQAVAHGLHRTRKRKRLRQVNRLSL